MKHLPLLVILIPLCGALLCPLLRSAQRVRADAFVVDRLFQHIFATTFFRRKKAEVLHVYSVFRSVL